MKSVSLLMAFLFLISCRPMELKQESPLVNTVKSNVKFRINLQENHKQGYIWELNQEYDHHIVEHINTVWHGNEKGVDFNFVGIAVGQVVMQFYKIKYRDTLDFKRFIVKISPH